MVVFIVQDEQFAEPNKIYAVCRNEARAKELKVRAENAGLGDHEYFKMETE